jgi:uncharacterized protein (DUF1800 family)
MKLSRRQLLKAAALAGCALPFSGCERLISRTARELGESVPAALFVPEGARIDPDFHLLSRAAYGPWPGDLDRVRSIGAAAWIDEQLAPEKIDDTLCDLRARRFETLYHEPGTCYEYKKPVLREEITRHTILRAVYSRRQLFEVMTGFWTDHLNINLEKGDCVYLKPSDDRLVVRAQALGRFRDLIRASATSPAMLVYLDGKENKKDIPNENYARELMELHTLGVHGGYTQQDVSEVARCLTGWRLRTGWRKGTVYFDPALHDDGPKLVLGEGIPAGLGQEDLDRVVDIVCGHPSTARHIATKLAIRFVSDDPPGPLVDRVAALFAGTGGDIKAVVRAILTSAEFAASAGLKLKRPFHYVASCLRALGADTHAHSDVVEYLLRMGQGPFQYPTPDGYPDKAEHWQGALLWRWNFAFAVASNSVQMKRGGLFARFGTDADNDVSIERLVAALGGAGTQGMNPGRLFAYLVGRRPAAAELKALGEYADVGHERAMQAELAGLIMASPAFQMH